MPYATPTSPSSPMLTTHSLGRPGHRRSYSSSSNIPTTSSINFSNERGPGAFTSLGSLPRRTSSQSPGITINTTPKFHLNTSSGSSSSASDSEEEGPPPPLKLKKPSSPSFGGVPFPKSSPLNSPVPGDGGDKDRGLLSPLSGLHSHITSSFGGSAVGSPRGSPRDSPRGSPNPSSSHLAPPLRPSPSRTSSSPILLSNGKPLKSSLKSSSSTSNIPVHHPQHPHHHHHHPHAHELASSLSMSSATTTASQQQQHPTHHHLRAQSAPSTPWEDNNTALTSTSTSSATSSAASSATNSPTATPKNVHFPSLPNDLEHIRVFNRSAKPISFLRRSSDASRGPNGHIPGAVSSEVEGQETETETETDREGLGGSSYSAGEVSWGGYGSSGWSRTGSSNNGYLRGWNVPSGSGAGDRMGIGGTKPGQGYPFPRVPSPPQEGKEQATTKLEMELQEGYTVPSVASTTKEAFVVLESLEMKASDEGGASESEGKQNLVLELTVLVRNVAYEKQVVFRFTMDDWGTVSEVGGKYLESVYSLNSTSLREGDSAPKTLGDVLGVLGGGESGKGLTAHSRSVSESALDTPPPYDRFLVTISLNDYLHLENRVMWGVARYTCPGTGEWWDNNGGKNFRVSWKRVKVPKAIPTTTNASAAVTAAAASAAGRERKGGVVGRSLSAPPAPPPVHNAHPPAAKPDVEKVQAQGEALQHRLSGFSLRNYVSPGAVKKSLPTTAVDVEKSGVGLYWPWGSSTATKDESVVAKNVSVKDYAATTITNSSAVAPGGSASVEVLPAKENSEGDYFSASAPSVTGPTTPSTSTPSLAIRTTSLSTSSTPSSRSSSMSSTTSDVPSLPLLVADDANGGMGSTSSSSESLDSLMFGGSPPTSTFRTHTRFVYGSPGNGDRIGIHDLDVGYRPGAFGGLGGHRDDEDQSLNLDKLNSVLDSKVDEDKEVTVTVTSPLSPPSPPSPPSSSESGSGSETERPMSSPEPSVVSSSPRLVSSLSLSGGSTPSGNVKTTTTGIPLGGGGGDSESLYKAFVKQWCFVESPRGGTPVTSPGGGVAGAIVGGEGTKLKA